MPAIGRNDPCHCGSGKKYKKCCESKDQAKEHSMIETQWNQAVKAKEKEAADESAAQKEPAGPGVIAKKPEPAKHAPPKHQPFMAPKTSMPRRTGGG